MASRRHVIVVLKAPRGRLAFVEYAKHILSCIETHPAEFPAPNPPIVAFRADVEALDASQTNTLTRARGAASARDVALDTVKSDLTLQRAYVQRCADLDPENAESLAHLAGMTVRIVTLRSLPDLRLVQGDTSGVIIAIARAAKGLTHFWRYSLDGSTWIELPGTQQARTKITGLTAGTTIHVSHRILGRKGFTDWCSPVSIVVH
jgi:hypothetical protein